jgi:5-oxoprolinase (ATP-hydrolysing) subunit A
MRTSVDINCDLGEGCPNDAELMKYISSANIACGFHAGDKETMRQTVDLAIENSVAIGAHPSFPDRDNFGRTNMSLPPDELFTIVSEQILALKAVCDEKGARLHHVKPHGALYNQAARDRTLASAIAEAVKEIDETLVLFGLAGSVSISEAQASGLQTASEVFADRTYQSDGSLTPRSQPNALIEDDEQAIAQALGFVNTGSVQATTGEIVSVRCDTICIHGDGSHAVSFAKKIREAFNNKGIGIKPPVE